MKILHVLDHSLPHYDGYAFRSWEIIRFTRKHGVDTVQVTSPKHERPGGALETVDGISYHRTAPSGGLYRLPVLDQIGVVTALRRRLLEVMEETRPDLLHVHSPSLNGLAALGAARASRKPVIYEVRSFWEDAAVDAGACREGDTRYRLTRASESHVVRRAHHVVPICRGIANDLKQRGLTDDKLTIVANSVDFSRFSAALGYDQGLADRYGLTAGRTVGFAGSFFRFEGLAVLIEAMALLAARDRRYKALLIGDGVERADLEAQVERRKLQDHVIFTGRVPHGDIETWYGIMDALVYPRVPMRLTELVTPLKPLEAMAYGKAVVASDVGGHRELIADGRSGLLFKAGDPQALAACIQRLFDEQGLRPALQQCARSHVETYHNWDITVQKYLQIYDRLLA